MISGEAVRLDIIRGILASNADPQAVLTSQQLDDAAVVTIDAEQQLVIASDFVRGSGFTLFELGYLSYRDVGYYLIAANLSDIAAMGVRPSGLLTVIRYTKAMADDTFAEIFRGMKQAADDYATAIIGGDTGSYSADVFAATAFGFTPTGRYLTRSGAGVGDIVCVSGPIGGGIGALTYCKEAKPAGIDLGPAAEARLLDHWRRPKPRFDVGLLLERQRLASACMDVSDGLKASLDQLARLSGVGFLIRADQLPLVPDLRPLANALAVDPLTLASSASVDFELLFTIPAARLAAARAAFTEAGLPLHEIGTTTAAGVMLETGKQTLPYPGLAWDHQAGDHVQAILNSASLPL